MSIEMLMQGVMAVQTAEDYVKIPGYHAVENQEIGRIVHEYESEGDFWYGIIGYLPGGHPLKREQRIFPGDPVRLRMFHLSYWVPRAPGLYWKEGSKELRGAAENELMDSSAILGNSERTLRTSGYWDPRSGILAKVNGLEGFGRILPRKAPIYTPLGKGMQVPGGIGNLRLLPSDISERLLCASSSGTYWQGIPVLVRGDAFDDLSRIIPGRYVDINGVWVLLPREYAEILGGNTGIQRGCLLVERKDCIKYREPKTISGMYGGTSTS